MPPALLDDVLGTTAKVRILRRLAETTTDARARALSGNALAREVKMSPNTVHRALKELADAGVVDLVEGPAVHRVRLAEGTALSESLKELFGREAALDREVLDALRAAVPDDVLAVLFGSFARGDATAGSDVDLLIVASSYERAAEVGLAVRDAVRGRVPNPVRSLAMTPEAVVEDWDTALVATIRREGVPLTDRRLEDLR